MRGPGGIGKTRLVAELCRRVRDAGMVAGFLAPGADAAALAGVAAGTTLVAIDEAHTVPGVVAGLLLAQAQRTAGGPMRVVLLARNAGDWWTQVVPDALAASPLASAACEGALGVALGPVDSDQGARREAFLEAAQAFRARLSPEANEPDPDVPDLSAPAYDAILYVHLAARRALEEGDAGREGPEELLAWALERERRYWRATAAAAVPALQVGGAVLERAVAVATLTVAGSEDEAAGALASVPDLAGEAGAQRAVARWLRDLYARPDRAGWFAGLTPDELGDELVAAVLAESPSIARGLLAEPSPDQLHHMLGAMARGARAHDDVRSLLAELVAQRLRALWPAALAVAQQSDGVFGSLLAGALSQDGDAELAHEILTAIPGRTVALRELAAVAAALVVAARRAQAERDPGARAALAEELDELAGRLSGLARFQEALGAAQEAVELNRALAAEDPALGTRLARSLTRLSNRYAHLGRHDAGLQAGMEAMGILQAVGGDDPVAMADVARSLSNLSSDLGHVGRTEEALGAVHAALQIQAALAEHWPDHFTGELAGSYVNLSNRLTDAGRDSEALAATQHAVALYRGLAEQQPDAYAPYLAEVLGNVSVDLRRTGAPAEAVAAAEESVALFRRLDAQVAGAFLPGLAEALNMLSCALTDAGRADEALRASEELVARRRDLVARDPGVFEPGLAEALRNLAIDLNGLGRREEALAARAEAMAITEGLAER